MVSNNYQCSCWAKYPNETHQMKNGKWKCVDKYECVRDLIEDKYYDAKTHCRLKEKAGIDMRMELGKDSFVEDSDNNLIRNADGITCGCGNPQLQMACHIDGVDFYAYDHVCKNCGNHIKLTCKRKKEDMWW